MNQKLFISTILAVALTSAGLTVRADTTFTFQGELNENGGLANGSFDMDFSLWDAARNGNQIDTTISISGVQVVEGKFAVEVNFGAAAFDNNDRWLAISVNGFTLSPRNPVTRAPYSIQTRGIFVDASENVGIGTLSPNYPLHVESNAGSAIYGLYDGTSVSNYGVYGRTDSSASTRGVFGHASAASGFTTGVQGRSNSTSGTGVSGFAFAASGLNYGVLGETNSPDGYAGYFLGGRNYFEGNVGIGTSDPVYPLEVDGNVRAGGFQIAQQNVFSEVASIGDDMFISNFGAGEIGLATFTVPGSASVRMKILNDGLIGIGTVSPVFLLHVDGLAGKPGGGSWSNASDIRLKRNVQPVDNALGKLLGLRGVKFEYLDPDAIHELPGERVGMIAQEVEKVVPDWVDTRADGYKVVTFRGFEALTVEALRQLRDEKDVEIASLRAENDALRTRLDSVEGLVEKLAKPDSP